MKVKKYVGKTIQDTIFKVKADLGSDAIIIDTRKYKTGGFMGLFAKEQVEVLAALEEDSSTDNKTLKEINDLKKMVADISNNSADDILPANISRYLLPLYKYLLNQGVYKDYSLKIVNDVDKDDSYIKSHNFLPQTRGYLSKLLGKVRPIKIDSNSKVVSFIGPTGVGKTTTIAKIAADFSINRGKKVGLVTADTYRIAAVQQLETYSNIVNVPLKIVYDSDRINKLLTNDFKNYDLVLIDTPGSSWRDQIQLGKLKPFTLNKFIDEVHLILGLNTKSKDIMTIVDKFSCLNPDRLLLTKLDETSIYGDIINLSEKYDIPFSYITYGQNVPEDIKIASSDVLLDYIMGDFYG